MTEFLRPELPCPEPWVEWVALETTECPAHSAKPLRAPRIVFKPRQRQVGIGEEEQLEAHRANGSGHGWKMPKMAITKTC
jgi:hypothetical protein